MKSISISGLNMKIKLLALFLQLFGFCVSAQKLVLTSDYRFLGYKDETPVFHLFGDDQAGETNSLYSISREGSFYGFKKLYEEVENANLILFIHDELIVEGQWIPQEELYNVSLSSSDTSVYEFSAKYSPRFHYSDSFSRLFIFFVDEPGKEKILSIDFNSSPPTVERLPLYGYRGYTNRDWLYFSFYHENYDYSPYPDDIFRVKMGDWNNPELVFTSDEYDNWFLYPESNVIATDIDLGDRQRNKQNQILYSHEAQAYDVIPNILTNRSSSPAYLKYEGKFYGFYTIMDEAKGKETIKLTLLPELPNSFSTQGHEVLPSEVWYNVPLRVKNFEGTFISDKLLRKAPIDELEKLSKSELRLLRNALYAQQGYLFSAKDLQDFFNQFEWYRMMTKKKKNNDDFVILKEDEERAEAIRAVESRKN